MHSTKDCSSVAIELLCYIAQSFTLGKFAISFNSANWDTSFSLDAINFTKKKKKWGGKQNEKLFHCIEYNG